VQFLIGGIDVAVVKEIDIQLGYSTYGMRGINIDNALSSIKGLGYDTIEIAAADGWSTSPDKLTKSARGILRNRINSLGFPPPATLTLLGLCQQGKSRGRLLSRFRDTCELAHDLNWTECPSIVTATLGDDYPEWESGRNQIVEMLIELAGIARNFDVVLAVEPHVGGAFDTPEKANWLVKQTNHDALRLNFDISHFHIQGMDIAYCAELCLPYTAHIHIKDGCYDQNGMLQFLLPGEGNLNLIEYLKILVSHKVTISVTVEVSGMIWKQPDYDPWETMRKSYDALDSARKALQPLTD